MCAWHGHGHTQANSFCQENTIASLFIHDFLQNVVHISSFKLFLYFPLDFIFLEPKCQYQLTEEEEANQCCLWGIFIYFSRTTHPNNFPLDTAFPSVHRNTSTSYEVEWMNGFQDMWRTNIQTDSSLWIYSVTIHFHPNSFLWLVNSTFNLSF